MGLGKWGRLRVDQPTITGFASIGASIREYH